MTRLEIVLRYRAGRWRWLLLSWFIGLLIFAVLLQVATRDFQDLIGHKGTVLFGSLQLFMLGLALFIVPALTSQSVNGDRERGRLGVLQVTELSSLDIALGKLLAAWGVACVFVLVSAPITLWAVALGGITLSQVVVVTVVMILLLGIFCAIGLGLSAIFARTTTSTVLTYVAVFILTIGTLIAAGLVSSLEAASNNGQSTGQAWYLLAPNPFVILADATPPVPAKRTCYRTITPAPTSPSGSFGSGSGTTICQTFVPAGDVLGSIRQAVRDMETSSPGIGIVGPTEGGPVWPYGLAFDLVVSGFLFWVAVYRLRTPIRQVPKGVRVA
jgi:ABC-2 type transport system permease protein